MDTYDDPPNPFSTDPSPTPSRDEPFEPGGSSSAHPQGSQTRTRDKNADYPELNIYPSEPGMNQGTEEEDEDDDVRGITAGYPELNLYPTAGSADDQPWSSSNANPVTPSRPGQQSNPQHQGQTASPPPPTYRPSFPNPGAGIKSYVGPKVKEEACCGMDEELQNGAEIQVSTGCFHEDTWGYRACGDHTADELRFRSCFACRML